MNRVAPFFQIIEVDGARSKRSDPESLPTELLNMLTNSIYIGPIESSVTTHGAIYDRWDRADDLMRFWPDTKTLAHRIMASQDTEYLGTLSPAFDDVWFDRWMMVGIYRHVIAIPNTQGSTEVVPANFDNETDDGCYWLHFPDSPGRFGRGLSYPPAKMIAEPFVNLVRSARRELLDNAFTQFINAFNEEYNIAVSVERKLKDISDRHSRWSFVAYFANLSNMPLIIENKAHIEVRDQATGTRFNEACELVLATEKHQGGKRIYELQETKNLIVVESGSSNVFGVMTTKTQGEMKLGNNLREVFNRGQGECRIVVVIQKVGLIKRQSIKSRFAPFVTSGMKS